MVVLVSITYLIMDTSGDLLSYILKFIMYELYHSRLLSHLISKQTSEFVNKNLPEYQETEREQEGKKLQ